MTKRTGPWHRWFAWHPVPTPDGWRWLCVVERTLYAPPPMVPFDPDPWWIYRPLQNEDTNE